MSNQGLGAHLWPSLFFKAVFLLPLKIASFEKIQQIIQKLETKKNLFCINLALDLIPRLFFLEWSIPAMGNPNRFEGQSFAKQSCQGPK